MRLGSLVVRTLAAVVVLTGFVDAASASMLYVDYLIREVPEDPNSNVIYIISLGIKAEQTDGDWVGWLIGEVAIVRPGSVGQTEAYWIEDSPYVPTSDGLWWVEHADPNHPRSLTTRPSLPEARWPTTPTMTIWSTTRSVRLSPVNSRAPTSGSRPRLSPSRW